MVNSLIEHTCENESSCHFTRIESCNKCHKTAQCQYTFEMPYLNEKGYRAFLLISNSGFFLKQHSLLNILQRFNPFSCTLFFHQRLQT